MRELKDAAAGRRGVELIGVVALLLLGNTGRGRRRREEDDPEEEEEDKDKCRPRPRDDEEVRARSMMAGGLLCLCGWCVVVGGCGCVAVCFCSIPIQRRVSYFCQVKILKVEQTRKKRQPKKMP